MRIAALSLAIAAALLSISALGDASQDMPPDAVEKRLKERYPATRITTVSESPVKGLYEVVMGRNVAYADESCDYMLFGHLFDMKAQQDLTARAIEDLNRLDVASLPLQDAIKNVQGKGERVLYVFSDPDCQYCQRLEPELAKLDNLTIYTFLYPLEQLHPEAKAKAAAIWCATSPAKSWRALMANDTDIIAGAIKKGEIETAMLLGTAQGGRPCDTPIDRNLALGARLGVNSTPTLIFADGRMIPGALPLAEIEKRLAPAVSGQAPSTSSGQALPGAPTASGG